MTEKVTQAARVRAIPAQIPRKSGDTRDSSEHASCQGQGILPHLPVRSRRRGRCDAACGRAWLLSVAVDVAAVIADLPAQFAPLVRAHALAIGAIVPARRQAFAVRVIDGATRAFMAGPAIPELTAALVHSAALAVRTGWADRLRPGRLRKGSDDQGGKNQRAVHGVGRVCVGNENEKWRAEENGTGMPTAMMT
jgi:hypothetical protein